MSAVNQNTNLGQSTVSAPENISTELTHLQINSQEIDEKNLCELKCSKCCATDVKIQNSQQETIDLLELRLEHLYFRVVQSQIINIVNFEELKLKNQVTTINDRVDTLFFEADIPNHWKFNVTWTETNTNEPKVMIIVNIHLISYLVKMKTKQLLSNYLTNNYENIVYIR